MSRSGVAVHAGSTVEGVVSGGRVVGVQVTEAVAELGLVPGLTAVVQLQAKAGHEGAAFPSAQGLSSLDAADFAGVGEAWVEWRGGSGVEGRLKVGRVDANGEFAGSGAASRFANPSFGLSPALGFLPSYPDPAWSVNGFVRPARGGPWVGAGVYRGGSGGRVLLGQLAGGTPGSSSIAWQAGVARGEGRLAGYAIVERAAAEGPAPFLVVARAAAPRSTHAALGLAVPGRGPLAGTAAGLALSVLVEDDVREGVLEASLELRPTGWLVLQPDVQVLAERTPRGARWSAAALLRIGVRY